MPSSISDTIVDVIDASALPRADETAENGQLNADMLPEVMPFFNAAFTSNS